MCTTPTGDFLVKSLRLLCLRPRSGPDARRSPSFYAVLRRTVDMVSFTEKKMRTPENESRYEIYFSRHYFKLPPTASAFPRHVSAFDHGPYGVDSLKYHDIIDGRKSPDNSI
jgi:hypothetical protein